MNIEESTLPVSIIIDNVMEGIVVINAQGHITTFNHAAEKIFGYAADEVIGRNISMLMPQQDAAGHDRYLANYVSTGQTRIMGQERELYGRHKDGSEFPISLRITEVLLDGARYVIGVVNDITEHKKRDAQLAAYHDRLEEEIADRRKLDEQLAAYHARLEDEKLMARALMDRIVRHDALDDPLLQWHSQPSDLFSGDIVAAQRGHGGALHLLLADATGHGLSAAISLLPTLGIFYTMVDKGFPVTQIIAEINKRLSETLPADRFLAAIFVTIDTGKRIIHLWNGSMPPLLLANHVSGELHEIRSTHPPLGVIKPGQFDAKCLELPWQEPTDLIIYSDGLTEAENAQGAALGEQALKKAVSGSPNGRFNRILNTLSAHLAEGRAQDDVTFAMIRLP